MTDDTHITLTAELRDELGEAADTVQQSYQAWYEWMVTEGKNPRREMSLGEGTASNYIERFDQLHRYKLQYLDGESRTEIEPEEADTLLLWIDQAEITKRQRTAGGEEYGESAKRKFSDVCKKYYEWRYHEGDLKEPWEPKLNFSDTDGESAARLDWAELGRLFDAAAEYGSLPSYQTASEDERDRINGLVAQRLGTAKEEVTRNDWIKADDSAKIHALVTVSYDAGLTPKEVAAAKLNWYDPSRNVLQIPSEDACKERSKTEVGLSDAAAEALSNWLKERRHLEKYDQRQRIWLNRDGNPYSSGSLCNIIRNLCEEADITLENRKIVWYSLRKTLGSHVTDLGSIDETNDQLRHDRLETTQEDYNTTPVEKLKHRLNTSHDRARKAAADPEFNPYSEPDSTDQARVDTSDSVDNTSSDAESVITQKANGDIHIDANVEDTARARVDISTQLLDGIDGDEEEEA